MGGIGTPTVVGGPNESENIAVGSGGILLSGGAANTATVTAGTGSGASTLFGGAGSVIDYNSTVAGATFVAGAGFETLNAVGSSTNILFSGGAVSGGNLLMVGGSGSDTMLGGAGSDTMTAGANATFFFSLSGTGVGADVITNFVSTNSLFLKGYNQAQSTFGHNSGGALTLNLSDGTQLTFSNLTTSSQLNGHMLYVT